MSKLKTFIQKYRFKILFWLFGAGSLVWFLIRVIPKPSRATYPCMRASYPIMTAFVLYLTAMFSSMFLFRKNWQRYAMTFVLMIAVFMAFNNAGTATYVLNADDYYLKQANQPIGTAQGLFPGRVVWVQNPDATNENMKNTSGDYWYMDKNCPQTVVDSMMVAAIRRVGGRYSNKEAWNNIFSYFNTKNKRGSQGYTPGEKIAIKINLTNSCCNSGVPNAQMDASPQMVFTLLKQLVNVVGVKQQDIWLGDPYRIFRNEYYSKCAALFPNVNYVDGTGNVSGRTGRKVTVPSASQVLVFSDKLETSSLPQHYLDATYLINMACLKTHDCTGISLCAKNHQGSILSYKSANGNTPSTQSAYYMHYALPYPPDKLQETNVYRHIVDYMGHKDLGGKTVLYIVDGIWAGKNYSGIVEKWKTAPFNNDYPSSVFMSQDAVAIESVGFDFLLAEYVDKAATEKYPYMVGADDYLKQAADPANWPSGIVYDPENDGTPIGSLGVYEHWNNPQNKQYSRNLGQNSGIELLTYMSQNKTDSYQSELQVSAVTKVGFIACKVYPNPFTSMLNIETEYTGELKLQLTDLSGRTVFEQKFNGSISWNGKLRNGATVQKGVLLLSLKDAKTNQNLFTKQLIHQ